MPRTSARERSRNDTRKRLMDAWREILIEQGNPSSPISEITEKAEVAVGTFYCHFKDKESLTQEVALESYSKLMTELDALEVENVQNWRSWTRATLDAATIFMERHPREFMFLLRLAPQATPEGMAFIERWEQFWCERAERILQAELAAGNIKLKGNPSLAARALVRMVNGLLEWWLDNPGCTSRKEVVRTLTGLLMSFYNHDEEEVL